MNEDLFGSIKQTITETAGAVGKKTEEFVETQKMRNKVRTLQREIRKKYADVGEIVYKRYVDGDTMDEELTGHCEVVMGLQKELAELRDEFNTKKAQWENEKKSVEKVQKLREEIEAVKNEIKMAQQKYDLEKAAELQYGKLWCMKTSVRKRLRGSSPDGQEFRWQS